MGQKYKLNYIKRYIAMVNNYEYFPLK